MRGFIYVNEDGKLQNLDFNERATQLVKQDIPIGLAHDDFIVGNMVIVGCLNEDGLFDEEDHDVPEHLIQRIIRNE